MAGADGMAFALLDHLALLGHALDDAVDRLLLVLLRGFDVVAIAQIGHGLVSKGERVVGDKGGTDQTAGSSSTFIQPGWRSSNAL